MNNEASIIVAKDTDVFLLLIYALGQLECVSFHYGILIKPLILICFTRVWQFEYLIFFSTYVLPLVVTRYHTKLMLKRYMFSKK